MPPSPPVAAGSHVDAVPTPALTVDERTLHADPDLAQACADAHGVALRPHATTHESPALAREQIDRGAVGICVAKLGEAETFAAAGIDDLVMANTTVGEGDVRRAARLAGRVRFAIGVDHPRQLREPSAAATPEGVDLRVRIVPNRVCPVVNLLERRIAVRDGRVVRVLPVATRERVD